ncbi:MAG: TonB-dependent receptor plug domain-containing protein, partial [Methanococcaceae archaeon]
DCTIIVQNSGLTASSGSDGSFQLKLLPGKYPVLFRHVAYEKHIYEITVTASSAQQQLTITLTPALLENQGVTVTAKRQYPSTIVQEIPAKDLAKMPVVYSDIIRSVQILPGVSTNNELSSSYNVRGGSPEENLIYLNGFEIYRPMLLRSGAGENQSLINPDLSGALKFSNGAFSALYGDKMSSALLVDYVPAQDDRLSGTLRADLMNMGLAFKKNFPGFSLAAGSRLAYPSLFLKGLQTTGSYHPAFSDIQINAVYTPDEKNSAEILLLYNDNKYDVTPQNWTGNFRSDRTTGMASSVELVYNGGKTYRYFTRLAGLKLRRLIKPDLGLNFSYMNYSTAEKENSDVAGSAYYYVDAEDLSQRDSIKTTKEIIHNTASLNTNQFKSWVTWQPAGHSIDAGGEFRIVNLESSTNEYYIESGPLSLQDQPLTKVSSVNPQLNSLSFYFNDLIRLPGKFSAELGSRLLIYKFTNEKLFSPRAGIYYYADSSNIFNFNTGIYYQPPFFNEFNGQNLDYNLLKSQRTWHSVLGWELTAKNRISFQAQLFYKKLDNLIPFYYDDLKIVYMTGNVNEGYAYGMDLMVKGEISKNINSWLGYSYLNSKERKAGSGEQYKRRLFDQTHTVQIFLQDKISRHPNWQSHLRLLAGSGFLFYNRTIAANPVTGKNEMSIDFSKPEEFLMYLRADMGLSARFDFSNNTNLLVIAELLNVFDKQNFEGYNFMQVFPDYTGVLRIPRVLSRRFLNIKVSFNF